ncbi:ABC transporter substrate-binding protein [Thauera sinica]|uniref:ABC transporter substrate-binding protein n=1 Tax=Thauera sinica TaxID=2665146 RepID=A0ABW1ANA1_9RHOO
MAGLALVAGISAGAARAAPADAVPARVFQHAQGEAVIEQIPRRVAVLDLGVLDILQAIGAEAAVAGVPGLEEKYWPEHLKRFNVSAYAPVGDLFEPDMEALKRLKPDLIIVGSRTAGKLEALGAIAPTLDMTVEDAAFMPSVTHNILTLGRILDRERQAGAVAEKLLGQVRRLRGKAAKAGSGLLLFGFGDSLSVQYPQTRFGVVYELLGLPPSVSAAEAPPPYIPRRASGPGPAPGSPEARAAEARMAAEMKKWAEEEAQRIDGVLQREPDWLLVIDRSAAFGERTDAGAILAANGTVTRSKAWQARRVVHLDGRDWYLAAGGPAMLEKTLDQFARALASRNP